MPFRANTLHTTVLTLMTVKNSLAHGLAAITF